MTYTTLDNWQAQLTAKGLSHNETVRLLQDARKQMDALQAELTRVKVEREQAGKVHLALNKAVCDIAEERDTLRAALQPFADAAKYVDEPMYTQDRYVAGLNTVEQYHEARRVLGEVKG